jgi:hypothetical protein
MLLILLGVLKLGERLALKAGDGAGTQYPGTGSQM